MIQPTQSSRRILLPARLWFIYFSLFAALVLNLIPLGKMPGIPDWLALVLVFWCIHQPLKVGMGAGFFFGAVMDVAQAGVMGQHALAYVLLAFTAGSVGSNLVLLGVMPLKRPVRLLLLMQPTRALLLLALLVEPPQWLFLLLLFGWGLNTGVTSTLVRTTIQEQAPDATRAQILSILQFSFMIAVPISSALLGLLVADTEPLAGLWPGVAMSLALFVYGFSRPALRDYRAPIPGR